MNAIEVKNALNSELLKEVAELIEIPQVPVSGRT